MNITIVKCENGYQLSTQWVVPASDLSGGVMAYASTEFKTYVFETKEKLVEKLAELLK